MLYHAAENLGQGEERINIIEEIGTGFFVLLAQTRGERRLLNGEEEEQPSQDHSRTFNIGVGALAGEV